MAVAVEPVPSALSHNDFRVDRLQFSAGIANLELPVNTALFAVADGLPGGGLGPQEIDRRKASALHALACH